MSDLIKALQIFLKYENLEYPTNCIHDTLIVLVDPVDVSDEDIGELGFLGFIVEDNYFISFKYGSC